MNSTLTHPEKMLKLATERAVDEAHGLIRAAETTAVGKSQLARCQSLHHADSLTLRDAHTLDRLGDGSLPILHALAKLHGCVVVALPHAIEDADELRATAMELTEELGDVIGAIREAMRDDEVVDEREADRIEGELDQMDAASARLRVLVNRQRQRPSEAQLAKLTPRAA